MTRLDYNAGLEVRRNIDDKRPHSRWHGEINVLLVVALVLFVRVRRGHLYSNAQTCAGGCGMLAGVSSGGSQPPACQGRRAT